MNGDILGYHWLQSGLPQINLVVKVYDHYIQFHQYKIGTICYISGHINQGESTNALEYPRISMFTNWVIQNVRGRQIVPLLLTTTCLEQYIIATIWRISGPIHNRATTQINTSFSNTYKVFAIMGNVLNATDWRPLLQGSLRNALHVHRRPHQHLHEDFYKCSGNDPLPYILSTCVI